MPDLHSVPMTERDERDKEEFMRERRGEQGDKVNGKGVKVIIGQMLG